MYRLNSLNADIQLIVDGAWESRFCMNYCCSELPNTIIQETSIQQMTVITFKKSIPNERAFNYNENSRMPFLIQKK